jgi:hypothetical protein
VEVERDLVQDDQRRQPGAEEHYEGPAIEGELHGERTEGCGERDVGCHM